MKRNDDSNLRDGQREMRRRQSTRVDGCFEDIFRKIWVSWYLKVDIYFPGDASDICREMKSIAYGQPQRNENVFEADKCRDDITLNRALVGNRRGMRLSFIWFMKSS